MKKAVALIISIMLVFTITMSTTVLTQAATSTTQKVTIRTTLIGGDLTPEQIKDFESQNKNIHVVQVTADDTKLMAMIAAGTAPDVIRVQGAYETPSYVTRGLALNLDPYFKKSKLIKVNDLVPIANVFRWDGEKQGAGPYYGLPKDFSPDNGLWINRKMFQQAGIPVPSPTKPLTYDQLADYAKKLVKKDASGKVLVYGFMPFINLYDMTTASSILQFNGATLFSNKFSKSNFSSPENKAFLSWIVNLAKSGAVNSPLFQAPDWSGNMFVADKAAIVQMGYWYSGVVRSNENTKKHLDDYIYLPAPIWGNGTKRYSPATTATGAIIERQSKNKDEAFKFFEWYMAGKPSDDRAKSGWGLPIWKSKYNELPQATSFDKQCYAVVQDEIKYMNNPLQFNPYLNPTAVNAQIDKLITPVYFGKDSMDHALSELDKQIQALIDEGKEIAGVE